MEKDTNTPNFPIEIFNKIFLTYLEIRTTNFFHLVKNTRKLQRKYDEIFVFSDYYRFPQLYIYYQYQYIDNKYKCHFMEIVQLMRYLVDNHYRINKKFGNIYYIKIRSLAMKKYPEYLELFLQYYRFNIFWKTNFQVED